MDKAVEFRLDPDSKHYEAQVSEFEVFAELIAKECRDIVGKVRDIAIEDGWNVDEAMSTAMYDIDEHFGFEE